MSIKFSIPYNNTDPEAFLALFAPYAEHIHSFYFGFPGIFLTHNPNHSKDGKLAQENTDTYRFLELTRDRFQTILCINTLVYPEDYDSFKFRLLRELTVIVKHFGLKAVNVASPSIARMIREQFPEVDIQTSCNTYTFLTHTYHCWNKEFGSTVFNLPREALRTPRLLEEFKETGFTSKCIVNEGCVYGCPGNIEHACQFIMPVSATKLYCDHCHYRLSDIFRSNFIPPHRLDEFEGRCDIAKIAGRSFPTDIILKSFLAYLNRDPNADLTYVLHGRCRFHLRHNKIQILASDWPKKTLTCECRECGKGGCDICEKAMAHVLKRNGIDPSSLPICI